MQSQTFANVINDLLFSKTLPAELFPNCYTTKMGIHLATNPVHIYTRNRRICICSGNLSAQLSKSKLLIKNECRDDSEIALQLSKGILSNAILAPGVARFFDCSLSLWEAADLMIYGDSSLKPQLLAANSQTQFLNLPSFSEESFKFKLFYCDTSTLEDSAIC